MATSLTVATTYVRCSATRVEAVPRVLTLNNASVRISLRPIAAPVLVERKQARDRMNARRRGEVVCGMKDASELIASGVVKALPPSQAGNRLSEDTLTWKLLDIRPSWERERAFVSGSLHVPLFIEDDSPGLVTALKRQIQFGFGGWWLGQKLTKENDDFVSQVAAIVPDKSTNLLVACGEGLRSLLAVDLLYKSGYTNLTWVVGGLNNAREGDFASVEGETGLQFSTAGGVQGLLIKLGQIIAKK